MLARDAGEAVSDGALEEVHEPFLIQEGYLQRTPQGRALTAKGYGAIGLKAATGGEQGALL